MYILYKGNVQEKFFLSMVLTSFYKMNVQISSHNQCMIVDFYFHYVFYIF